MAIPINVRCECGETHAATLGEAVECSCGRRYDTSALPPARFAHVRARQARVRLYLQLGFIFMAGVAVVAAIFWGLKGLAVAVPFAGLLWFLFLGKWYRRRWLRDLDEPTTMQLEGSEP